MSDLINRLRDTSFALPCEDDTGIEIDGDWHPNNVCTQAADALEGQAAELLSQQEKLCSYILELGRTRELCDQLGEALEAFDDLIKYKSPAYEALTTWRESK